MKFPRTPSFELTSKRALISGASSGIGLAGAIALAERGATITIAARRGGKLREIADQMVSEGWNVTTLEMDVADIEKTARDVTENGPYDILLNSAGLARHCPAAETTFEDFDAVMNVNLRGAYFLTQAVAKGLVASGLQGSLINISSQMGHVGGIDRAVYCASKFAVEGFTKAMALEFAKKNIRINTICPTFILTELTQNTFEDSEKKAWILDKIKLGRPGEIEDVMGAIVYLASDASSLVTGSSLMVDGGWTAD